jgi:malonate transporter
MFSIMATTAPIFILILLGYMAVKTKLVPVEAVQGMSKIVLFFTLPALIFSTLARMEFDEVIVPLFLATYAGGSLLALGLGLLITRYLFKKNLTESGLKALGISNSNSAFFGYPVMLLAFEHPPTAAFAMALIIENMLIIPIALFILELSVARRQGISPLRTFFSVIWRLLKHPLVLAVVGGVLASTLHLDLPEVMDRVLNMLSGASATLALIVLGGALVGTNLKGNLADVSLIVSGKLILHPAMMLLMIWLLPSYDSTLQMGAILLAAVPMMSIYPILGSQYGYRNICASALLMTTICSFFTLALLLSLLSI